MTDLGNEVLEQLKLSNRILAQTLIKDTSNQTERIVTLAHAGFAQCDIANLLDIKSNIVSATLSRAKKAGAKKQKSKTSTK